MSLLELLALALGLAMDATAVSIASTLAARQVRVRDGLLLAGLFGLFQALMPLIGWAVGSRFADAIASWDHWLAFGLLAAIGGHMIHEALGHDEEKPAGGAERQPFALRTLTLMALATSVDALAAGVVLPTLDVHITLAVGLIGVVTFVLCLGGVGLGRRLGTRFGRKLDVLGGLILIGLGLKTLVEHLSH